jgi:hypothetical protein
VAGCGGPGSSPVPPALTTLGKAALAALFRLAPAGSPTTVVRDPDLDATNRFGRLLRYVVVGGRNVNLALTREGAASPYFFRGDVGRYTRAAHRGGRGEGGEPRLLGLLPAGPARYANRLHHRLPLGRP